MIYASTRMTEAAVTRQSSSSPMYQHQQTYGHYEQPQEQQHHQQQHQHESRFSCNICLDAVMEPVVTQCGHLYCWPCLYRWLEPGMLPGERQSLTGNYLLNQYPIDESRRVCPVCKAPCSVPTIVPIYALIEPPEAPVLLKQQQVLHDDESNNKKKNGKNTDHADDDEYKTRQQQANNKGLDSIPSGDDDEEEDGPHNRVQQPEQEDETEAGRLSSDYMSPTAAAAAATTTSSSSSSSSVPMTAVGIRQRHRYFTFDDGPNATTNTTSTSEVPARPMVVPPRTASTSYQYHQQPPVRTVLVTTSLNATPPPNHHSHHRTGTLGQGIAISFQQALMRRVGSEEVPPLHHQPSATESAYNRIQQVDPDATEYLSRILLMLGSFVILCLLLF